MAPKDGIYNKRVQANIISSTMRSMEIEGRKPSHPPVIVVKPRGTSTLAKKLLTRRPVA